LSLEITRECPLRCPGCYAYEDHHLGTTGLRSLADFKGEELIRRVLALVEEHDPLHLSIVGGDPLVRYRELEVLLPKIVARGTHVQVVTSAFRQIPLSWAKLPRLQVSVSIDGLQPEHDMRRKPATYERILKNIEGQHVAVHCTITGAMVKRTGYLREFLEFWSPNPAVERIWMSIFTPQRGVNTVECLSAEERRIVIERLQGLRSAFPKLDMSEAALNEFLTPPSSPDRCIFAMTTKTISADLKTVVQPCQLGGDPDCSRCGCFASMGLASIGNRRVLGKVTAGDIFFASAAIGRRLSSRNSGVKIAVRTADEFQETAADEKLKIIA
jgi:MoaA/NifB/PqqE/SkfB family radical SAM enzyme